MCKKIRMFDHPLSELRYNLNYYGADYPVSTLVARLNHEEFIIPDFQRGYVWTSEQSSKFIESLLLGLPVPSIFLAKDKFSNKFIIIDGHQRLKTLQYFYQGKFRLRNVIKEFDKNTYENLSSSDRRQLDNTIIHSTIISESSGSNGIFYVFERLNTTGSSLTSQEIRSAIYHGKFNDLLKMLNQSPLWKALNQNTKDNSRLEGEELILGFFALCYHWDFYKGNMKDFLNDFMLKNRNFELVNEVQITKLFEQVFSLFNVELFDQLNKNSFFVFSSIVARNCESINSVNKIDSFYKALKEYPTFKKLKTLSKKTLEELYNYSQSIYTS